MNLWVLFLCRFFLHSKAKLTRIITAALLAASGEILVILVPFGNAGVKLVLGFGTVTALVVAWLFRPGSRKYYGKLLVYSYVSALFLGSMFLILEMILPKNKISFYIWGLGTVILVILIKEIYGYVNEKSRFGEVVLTFGKDACCRVNALVDSGNGLVEPISKAPVSLVEKSVIMSYKEYLREENFRIVPYHSVGKEYGILEAYFIEKMEIEKDGEKLMIEKPLIALTEENISVNERYQMILHPIILKQGGMEIGL